MPRKSAKKEPEEQIEEEITEEETEAEEAVVNEPKEPTVEESKPEVTSCPENTHWDNDVKACVDNKPRIDTFFIACPKLQRYFDCEGPQVETEIKILVQRLPVDGVITIKKLA